MPPNPLAAYFEGHVLGRREARIQLAKALGCHEGTLRLIASWKRTLSTTLASRIEIATQGLVNAAELAFPKSSPVPVPIKAPARKRAA